MKTMSKIAVRLLLVCMIFLSIYLSKKIWVNVSNHDTKTETTTQALTQTRHASDILLPDKLYVHRGNKVLLSVKESLISQVMSQLYEIEVQKVTEDSIDDEQVFIEKQALKNGIELTYTSAIPFDYFTQAYGLNYDFEEKITFDRILIDFDESKFYFLNDEDNAIYEVVTEIDDSTQIMSQAVNQNDISYLEVEKDADYLVKDYFYVGDLTLKQYSYILSTQPYTNFVQLLFSDRTDLFSNDNSSNVSLSNGLGENLLINSSTGIVSYIGRLEETDISQFEVLMNYGLKLGTSLGNIRYFGQVNESSVIFSNYVEGYPVFGTDYRGTVNVNIEKNGTVRLETHQDTIQIPVPSDEVTTLKSMPELLNELVAAGVDVKQIKQIHIGYHWTTNSEASQVVDLIPDWYVEYGGVWYNQAELLNNINGGGK